ncbi:SpoIIE family protein phosphatase [Streptomyces sp. NPDC059582]|uniref:ATP-binding SpoIIE family protein phosphatase n=1 Tax=Streptomyces sp. NPDC059582 TaxID=3346875 RepID=UPI003695D1AC
MTTVSPPRNPITALSRRARPAAARTERPDRGRAGGPRGAAVGASGIGRAVVAVLVGCIALISARELETAGSGLVRWSDYAVLTPSDAASLLRMWHAPLVAALAVPAVGFSCCAGYVVCRVRTHRDRHLRRLGIARDRLALLTTAGEQVGSTPDVTRTAEELAEAAVPRFADFVTVDLFDAVLGGEEPPAGPFADVVTLRRAAQRPVAPGPAPEEARQTRDGEAEEASEWRDRDAEEASHARDRDADGASTPRDRDAEGASAPRDRDAGGASAPRDRDVEGASGTRGRDDRPRVTLPARWLETTRPGGTRYLDDADTRARLTRDRSGPVPSDRSRTGASYAHGGRAAILAPLRAHGATLGVVTFLRDQRRAPYDGDDLVVAGAFAKRAAVSLDNARRHKREHEAALRLRGDLRPGRLPELSAVEVASRRRHGGSRADAGGDWVDVIPLSGARVALVAGEVVGNGLHISAAMTRLRTAVRTLSHIDLPPDELLTHLDDVVVATLSTESESGAPTEAGGTAGEASATCLYAVYDPAAGRLTLASAGHQPPVMVLPDGSAQVVELPVGPALGGGHLPFEATETDVPQGSLLALCTDGLVRSRPRGLDIGRQELLTALAGPAGEELTVDEYCESVLDTLSDGRPEADAALLVARTHVLDTDHVAVWDLPLESAAVADARASVSGRLAAWGLKEAIFTTELVVSELVTNAIRYATPPVRLQLIRERDSLICEVSDGSSTSPHARRARIMDEGGRGLLIVAQLVERWGTRHGRGGKTIWAQQAVESDPGPAVAA